MPSIGRSSYLVDEGRRALRAVVHYRWRGSVPSSSVLSLPSSLSSLRCAHGH
jgi:hypothetical protein